MEQIEICINVSRGLTAILIFQILRKQFLIQHTKVLGAFMELSGFIKEKEKNSTVLERLERWLCKKGAAFHFGKWISPVSFILLSMTLSMVGFWVIGTIGNYYGLLGMVFLGALPSLLVWYCNRRDNEELIPELKLVYHALEIQIKAGVYLLDALTECHESVQNERLKNALLEMAGDIVMKADIYEVLDKFQGKFENKYVDSMCITILQAMESGQAVDLLKDVAEQLKDMEESVLERKKGSLDRSLTFCQLGVLTVVLGLVLYACVSYMFGAAVFF